MTISSRSNARVKWVRSLRSRKERERDGLFFAEGVHLVAAAAQGGAQIEAVVVAPELLSSALGREILEGQARRGTPIIEVTADVFRSLAYKETAQGIGAVVHQRWEPLERAHPSEGRVWVALYGVQYPGNLGTVLRSGDAVGCAGAILLDDTTDPYDPSAVRASMGAVFSQRLVRAGSATFAAWKRRHSVTVVGTSPAAPTDYESVRYPLPFVLLMGCERGGLPAGLQALCDAVVRIPMVGRCDSLNLAVSTSIVLYATFLQHRVRPVPEGVLVQGVGGDVNDGST